MKYYQLSFSRQTYVDNQIVHVYRFVPVSFHQVRGEPLLSIPEYPVGTIQFLTDPDGIKVPLKAMGMGEFRTLTRNERNIRAATNSGL